MSSRNLPLPRAGAARLPFTVVPIVLSLFAALGSVGMQAQTCGTTGTSLSSTRVISTPDVEDGSQHTASPYGDGIAFSGLSGTVCKVQVELLNVQATSNISLQGAEVILVAPDGNEKFELMGGPGEGTESISNLNLIFDDSSNYAYMADGGAAQVISPTSGTSYYKSTSYEVVNGYGGTFPYPNSTSGPATPSFPHPDGSATLSVFNGVNPNGTWKLYLVDDFGFPETIHGWTLTLYLNQASIGTTTSISGNANPVYTASPNNSVTYTATVRGSDNSIPTGTVTFYDGGSALSCSGGNPATLSGGQATCSTSFSAQGNHLIKATYNATGSYTGSTSGSYTQVVTVHTTNPSTNKFCNTGSISIGSGTPVAYPSFVTVSGYSTGQTVSNVAVELDNMSGSAGLSSQFLLVSPDGAHNLDFLDTAWNGAAASNVTATLYDTAGQYPTGNPASGNYAAYDDAKTGEESAFPASSSPDAVSAVPQVPGSINYAYPHGSSSNTFEAMFNGATANGDWALYAYGNTTMAVNGGWCITLTPNTGLNTTTTVTSNNNSARNQNYGHSVTLTATVKAGATPVTNGTVTFLDNGVTPAGTSGGNNVVTLNANGQAAFTTSSLSEGDHNFTVNYNDSSSTYNPSFATFVQRIDRTTTISAGAGGSYNYCNTGAVTGSTYAGAFTPNPSNIFISSLPGTVRAVSLTLNNLEANSGSMYGIDSLLAGPTGTGLDFLSNTGSTLTTTQTGNYTFSDNASGTVGTGNLTPGTYQPTTDQVNGSIPDNFSASTSGFYNVPGTISYGAPAGSGTFAGSFNGISPNGTWSLFFNARTAGNLAEAQGGWCLNLTENPVTASAVTGHIGSAGTSGSNFVRGETGAAITVDVTNEGSGSTGDPLGTNPLTVTDTLNSGLTYTGFSGTGWSCSASGQTVTCTNDSSVPQNTSYPTLTLNVNVSASAALTISNSVSVSGAGTTGTSATDAITVTPNPSLAVSLGHSGTFTQGSTAEWDIIVTNTVSGSSTSGTITVTDTLPTGYTLNGSSSAGNAWGCGGTANTVTCTSTTAINGGSSSMISLSVDVPAASATSVSNTASAYGGGDTIHSPGNPAVSNTDVVTVIQVPATVVINAGNSQSAQIMSGFGMPLSVSVRDSAGTSIANYGPVSFTAATGPNGQSGIFSNSSGMITGTTDVNGQVRETVTANTRTGSYSVTATAGTAQTTFTLTNLSGPASSIALASGSGQSTQDLTAFGNPLVANVTDAGGNPVAGASVTFTAPAQTGASLLFAGGVNTAITDGLGNATSPAITANSHVGTYSVTANIGSAQASFQLSNTVGPYTQLVVTAPAVAYQGKQFVFTVQKADGGGNAIAPFTGNLQFSSSDGAAVIQQMVPKGDYSNAYYVATLNTLGPQTITVTDPAMSFSSTSGTITVNAAPNLVVTTTSDDAGSPTASNCTVQAAPGTGTDASCSLRDALLEAASLGAANITFDSRAFATAQSISPGATLTIPANTGISGPTTGSGASLTNLVTIQGANDTYTLFTVASGTFGTSVANLIVRDNANTTGGPGAINNAGHLTVNNVEFRGNQATAVSTGTANGGAISNSGTLTVSNSLFSGNQALPPDGSTGNGGAIYSAGNGILTVTNSTFAGNQARTSGGAIYDAAGMTTAITNSTFSGNIALNSAGGGGGAIYNAGTASLTVADSTFANNKATLTPGGAIFNEAGSGQNISLVNSIVSSNLQGTTSDDVYDLSGYITTIPGNVIGVLNTAATGSGMINLGPLANYGGSTQTMLPLPGSPAICAGSTQFIPVGVTTDQRGLPNTNTTYPGYAAGKPCVDAGAVQTNYAMTFSSQPSPISPATEIKANTNFKAAVTLTESGIGTSGVTIPLALKGAGTLSGGSAVTAAGIATYSALKTTLGAPSELLNATLTLNGAVSPAVALTATSSPFAVHGGPYGWIDRVLNARTLTTTVAQADNVLVSGWAADPQDGAPVSSVKILIDGNMVGNATLGQVRGDIPAAFNNPTYLNSGWSFSYPAAGLSLGTHVVTAVASDSLGLSATLATVSFTVSPTSTGAPRGTVDRAIDQRTHSTTVAQADNVLVSGWAVDPQDGAPVRSVKILIDGNQVGSATLGQSRSDVAAAYNNPAYLNSGWSFSYPAAGLSLGTHVASAVISDSVGLSTTLGAVSFTVSTTSAGAPLGNEDQAVDAQNSSTTVNRSHNLFVRGWAADPQDGAPVSSVTILIDGNQVGSATLGQSRPDVSAAYNNPAYLSSGWTFTYAASSLSTGTHVVTAIAHDSLNLSTTIGTRTITVQ